MSKENLHGIYTWLKTAPVPKMIEEALRFYGVKNNFHDPNNPIIRSWANILQVDVENFYESNSHHHYNTADIDKFVRNHSTTDLHHLFGQNFRLITEGHLVPWCGLFMGIVAHNSGNKSVKEPLYPINWVNFGSEASVPMFGDILIFIHPSETNKKAGNVGLYIGEDSDCYHVLGGNENDTVCITRILKSRLYTARRPKYEIVPDCVKIVALPSNCNVTRNMGILSLIGQKYKMVN
jgi:uncharacterized protein (TIGR02594 family)